MDYHYETLDDQKFQKLAQALIVAQHPNTQCLPVGQPDGGRDAYFFHPEPNQDKFVVFQVKFSRDPQNKTERDAIEALIKSEQEKVEELIHRGATHYLFVTNIQGTAHLGVGSIDKAIAALTEAFGIPAQVWWRDDMDRRLDQSVDLKWSYPEILKATDLLPLLIRRPEDTQDLQSARSLKSYMAAQYTTDRDIKFKQVDLKRKLTALFVDLPLAHKRPQIEQDHQRRQFHMGDPGDIDTYISQLYLYEHYEFEGKYPFDHLGLAGAFLLQMPLGKGVSRFVVEGAPGQGKSTVTQFLCQVNRLRLLRKIDELEMIADEHKTAPVRAPFRVDLRDYATWVSGHHPFANTGEQPVPEAGRRSLESFLAMQVNWQSGGLKITQDKLLQFFARSHSVVVLDGFDEVADIAARKRIVEEICEAAERLDAHAKSMQVIVTSRPAAFSNSPGFPEDNWIHLELKDLRRSNIEAYKDKWIEAQELNDDEGRQVSSTLHGKLDQPHLRDLARNPMQLAILLHLIHVQGAALPEKRTILYEEYMKLFFNREAEKSVVVRDHRELLLSIHGMLAWGLHTQSEDGSGSGRITKAALRDEVRAYLVTEEHDPRLAGELFKGTVERIGALVSRIEGMFEFEVQPLREYFAARHLYKTASHSPVGHDRKGTRPDRFEAMARSLYWTNVTRFFCGFYDVGELGGLVDGITGLGDQDGYNLINQPRRLAMMLLSDQVFSQSPRAMKRLIAFVVHEPGFQRLTSAVSPRFRRNMGLPTKAGGSVLFETCVKKLEVEDDPSRRHALREVMAENADRKTRKSIWMSRFKGNSMKCAPLREAEDLGIINYFKPKEIQRLTNNDVDFYLRWLILSDDYEAIVEDPNVYKAAGDAFFDDRLAFPNSWHYDEDRVIPIKVLTALLRPRWLAEFLSVQENHGDDDAIFAPHYAIRWRALHQQLMQQDASGADEPLASFMWFVSELMRKDISEWQQSLELWSILVDRGFEEASGSQLMVQISIVATASSAKPDAGVWDENGFSATKGLVSRLFFARHKSVDTDWWRARIADVTTETACLCLTILLSWGTPDLITALKADIEPIIERLSSRDWSRLWSMVSLLSWRPCEGHSTIPEDWFVGNGSLSPRMAVILIDRVGDQEAMRRLSRNCFIDYVGDDPQILRYASRIEMMEAEDHPIDWDHIQHLSKRARQVGVHTLFPEPQQFPSDIPKAIAEEVLSDCENHCEQLVATCEQAYAAIIAQDAPKVVHLAADNSWFADPD